MLRVAAPGRALVSRSPYQDSDRDHQWEFTVSELLHRWCATDVSAEVARIQLQVEISLMTLFRS